MLLVIDIGNTNIVLGVFQEDRLTHSWRVSTRRDQTAHEYAVLCRNLFILNQVPAEKVEACIISSVVPPLNEAFAVLAEKFFGVKPLFVDPEGQDLIRLDYYPPSDVGADRIVNALAVREMHGTPAIVVDFGTATTFDAVSAEGHYVGGVIAPGIGISAEALYSRAARLPRIEILEPEQPIGQTTVASMQAGLFYGYVDLVEGIIRRMKKVLGSADVTATGGFARLISRRAALVDRVDDDLTLRGLHLYFKKVVRS